MLKAVYVDDDISSQVPWYHIPLIRRYHGNIYTSQILCDQKGDKCRFVRDVDNLE